MTSQRFTGIVSGLVGLLLFATVNSAHPQDRRRGPGNAREGGLTARTLPKDDAEKKILEVLEDIGRTQRAGNMTVPEQDGRILRLFAETVNAKHVVELGTSVGYSGTWFCLALQKTGGKLTTFEIDADRAAKARANFKRAGVEKMVTLVEGNAHQEVLKLKGEIDVLFLDADKEGYIDYLNKLLPQLRAGGLVIAHNIDARMADPAFIKAITSNPELETIFLNQETSGISVSLKKR